MAQTAHFDILLTNDDGIDSPGLWAASRALRTLGKVHIVAPERECSGYGRSKPNTSTGKITVRQVAMEGEIVKGYAVNGSPAQAVLHGVLEIAPHRPDLVVSGINYGENVGTGVTISGTVGAALEAASLGIPSLAVGLEVDPCYYSTNSDAVDFGTAGYFTALFANILLYHKMPEDVAVLKLDVPSNASQDTPWETTHLGRPRDTVPAKPLRTSWREPGRIREHRIPSESYKPGSDAHAVRLRRTVAVTPLSLNLTSRTELAELQNLLQDRTPTGSFESKESSE